MTLDEDWLDLNESIQQFRTLCLASCEADISQEVFKKRYKKLHAFAPEVYQSIAGLVTERLGSGTLAVSGRYVNANHVVCGFSFGDYRVECRTNWGSCLDEEGNEVEGATAYHFRIRLYSERLRIYNLRLRAALVIIHSNRSILIVEGNPYGCEDKSILEAFALFQKLWKKLDKDLRRMVKG